MNEPIEQPSISANISEKLPKKLSKFEDRILSVLKWTLSPSLMITTVVPMIVSFFVTGDQGCGISSHTGIQNVTTMLENSTLVEFAPMASTLYCALATGGSSLWVADTLRVLFACFSAVFIFFYVKERRISKEIERILLVTHEEITQENASLRNTLSTAVSSAQSIAPYVVNVATGEYGYQPPSESLGSPAETTISTRFPTPYEVP